VIEIALFFSTRSGICTQQGSSAGPAKEESALEVVTVSGRVVRVSRDFDAETLRRLLDVLEDEAC